MLSEKRRQYLKDYRENYGTKMRRQIREWFKNHPNYLKEWRERHPNYHREWREKNRERYRNYMREYMRRYRKRKAVN